MKLFLRASALMMLFWVILAARPLAQAPDDEDHDIIVLNDGGVARGTIVEIVCGDYVSLELPNGGTIKVDYDDVRLITDSEHYREWADKLRGDCVNKRGVDYEFVARGGLLFGESETHFACDFIIGPRLSRGAYFGMGIGWETIGGNLLSAQLHLYYLTDLLKGADHGRSLFVHLSGGYAYGSSMSTTDVTTRGARYTLSLGATVAVDDGTPMTVEAGYLYQSFRLPAPSHRRDYPFVALGVRF